MPSFDIETDMSAFEGWLKDELEGAVNDGLYSAGLRILQTIQVELIPKAMPYPPVDRGVYRAAWQIAGYKSPEGVSIYNPTPHAPIIEWGARAENIKVGRKMIDALEEWVQRKGLSAGGKKEGPEKPKVERPAKPKKDSGFPKALAKLLKNLADFLKQTRSFDKKETTPEGKEKSVALSDTEARSIAWAIAMSMKKKGIFGGTGLRIMEQAIERAPKFIEKEVAREITRQFGG